MKTVTIDTKKRNQMIDITSIVETSVSDTGIKDGMCYVFVPHTTAQSLSMKMPMRMSRWIY